MAEMDRERGRRIAQLRDAHGWTQRELAQKLPGKNGLGVDVKSVQNWEAGKELLAINLRALAELFNVSQDFIRFGESERPDLTEMLSPNGGQPVDELRAELAAIRDDLAALETNLTKQLRSIARKLGTGGRGSQSQPGG